MSSHTPEFREIATLGAGRDITRPFAEALLSPQDAVLMAKGQGDLRIYEKVLQDWQVQSCLQQRFDGLTKCEWEVVAGGDKRADLRAAQFVEEQLRAIEFDDICEKMLYGIFYGFSVAEVLWARDGSAIVFDQARGGIRPRNRRRFKFGPDGLPRLITLSTMTTGEELPPRKFWHFSVGGDNSDDPNGKGLGHWLFWPTFFKRSDIRFWLTWVEKEATGKRVGKYPPGSTKDEQDKLLRAAYSLGTDSAVIIPDGMALELLEAGRSATPDYATLHDKMDAAISKVILSQTMTTDDGSSRAQAQVHDGVKDDIVAADDGIINGSFNRSVVRWLVDYNRPILGSCAYPQVWRRLTEEPDLKPQAERDNIIVSWGFQPKAEYIRAAYGDNWVLPEQEEDQPALAGAQIQSLLEVLTQAQQGKWSRNRLEVVLKLSFPMLPEEQLLRLLDEQEAIATVTPVERPIERPVERPINPTINPPIEAGLNSVAAFSQAIAQRDPIASFVEQLQRRAQPELEKMVNQLRSALDESADLLEFRERLDALYPDLDGETLTQVMAEAMFASRLAGLFEAQQESADAE